uniref:Uncharacterized protein n=1 Tax=Romanomermis culicivorax TaxID=13658 RepID=A0A915JWP1_ROMCU
MLGEHAQGKNDYRKFFDMCRFHLRFPICAVTNYADFQRRQSYMRTMHLRRLSPITSSVPLLQVSCYSKVTGHLE